MWRFRCINKKLIGVLNVIRLVAVCVLGYFSCTVFAGHPASGGLAEMAHPVEPLAPNTLVPSVRFKIIEDSMDGYNIVIDLDNFNMTIPLEDAADSLTTNEGEMMSGHLHLYINSEKMMRVYGPAIHVPASWLNEGINTVTLSVNNHRHGTFTHQDKEVQSTAIIDTRSQDNLVKTMYNWPTSVPKAAK